MEEILLTSHPIEIAPVPDRCNIEVPVLSESDLHQLSTGAYFDFIRKAAETLRADCVVRFRIGNRIKSGDEALLAAKCIAEALNIELKRHGAPQKMFVEVDRAQTTYVPEGFTSRTLLPHHDAAHVSYLTPSRLDYPDFDPADRSFSGKGYTSGKAHKIYQGIFIANAGDRAGVTAYYPLLPLICAAYVRLSCTSSQPHLADCAQFLGLNIRSAIAARESRSTNYLTLPAALGSVVEEYNSLAPHAGEADFPEIDYERFPQLKRMVADCVCGSCVGAQGRFFCNSLNESLGLDWPSLNKGYGVAVRSETFDLIIANNLNLIHAGLAGGSDRVLVPVCLVMENTDDPDYERWLADAWRQQPLKGEIQSFWPIVEERDVVV